MPLTLLGFFPRVLGWFAGHPALAAMLALGLALTIQSARLDHAKSDLTTLRKANAEAQAHSRILEANALHISESASKSLDQREAQIIVRYKTLIQKVPQYVTAKDDAGCRVPPGFVELWNAPIDGELPSVAGQGRPAAGSVGPSAGR